MKTLVRSMSRLLAATVLCAGAAMAHAADPYPARPVRIIVPYAAGGGTDATARIVATQLGERMKATFVVENRAGGNTRIGTQLVQQAEPDGYTLVMFNAAGPINQALDPRLPYDVTTDFSPITVLVRSVGALWVNTDKIPVASFDELIAFLRAHPGTAYASSGVGAANHLAMEVIKERFGLDMLHVPFKGSSEATTAVASGEVPLSLDSFGPMVPHWERGRVRPLVVTSDERFKLMAQVPTFAELGYPELQGNSAWWGIAGPKGMPAAIVQTLNQQIHQVLADPKVVDTLTTIGAVPAPTSVDGFNALLRSDLAKWQAVVKKGGIQTN